MWRRNIAILLTFSCVVIYSGCTLVTNETTGEAPPATRLEGGGQAEEMDHEAAAMGHSRTTLYVATLNGEQVVPATQTVASGTGAFVMDSRGDELHLSYDLTFDGLTQGAARIVLRNFGEGGVGDVVHVICGEGDRPVCPAGSGGTLSSSWTSQDELPLTPALAHELTSLRLYVEIETAIDEPGEIRGQLVTNGLMLPVQGFVSQLAPVPSEATAAGSGTAAFFFVRFPDGTEQFTYNITVTGMSSPFLDVQLVADGEAAPLLAETRNILTLPPIPRIGEGTGGTVAGRIERGSFEMAPLSENATALTTGNLSLVITTETNEAGELVGVVTPLE